MQTGEQDDRRRLRREVERRTGAAHQRGQFPGNDAHERLAGRQRADDFFALRLVADRRNEILDDRQRHVGLEEREPHFTERVLDVRVGEARLTAERLDDAG